MGGTPRRMRPRKATLPRGLVLGWPRPRKVAPGEEPGTTAPASAILSRFPLHACKYGARGDGSFWSATVLMVAACARPATVAAARVRPSAAVAIFPRMAVPLEPLLPPGAPCQATFARARRAWFPPRPGRARDRRAAR